MHIDPDWFMAIVAMIAGAIAFFFAIAFNPLGEPGTNDDAASDVFLDEVPEPRHLRRPAPTQHIVPTRIEATKPRLVHSAHPRKPLHHRDHAA